MFSVSDLSDEQRQAVTQWVANGADLSTVQKRLQGEYELLISYMDTRFLVSDLGLTIQEAASEPEEQEAEEVQQDEELQAADGLDVFVDDEPIPGCMISGVVTFSDGEKGMWYIDETGRPGLEVDTPDYQPSAEDVQAFQARLHDLLAARQGV